MDIVCNNCGSINDYRTEKKANNNCAFCNSCDRFIKNVPSDDKPKFHFGKYKDTFIEDCNDMQYLIWARDNLNNLKGRYRTALIDRINSLSQMLR